MKRLKLIIICLCIAFYAVAQTQQILVKTRGKIDSTGHVIPGKRLSGVIIEIRKVPNTHVTNHNGWCAIHLKDSIYTISRIEKKGYRLVDLGIIGRKMKSSPNFRLIIVMDTIDNFGRKKTLDRERSIRLSFQRHLQIKENELDSLKKQNRITPEEYQKELQQLYTDYQNNGRLISEWKELYAITDYDHIDELDLEIAHSIITGDFTMADSLLYNRDRNIAYLERELQSMRKELEMVYDKTYIEEKKELIAKKLYRLFELYKIQEEYETAADYLEERAQLDSLNIEWNLDAGKFILDYLFDKQNENKSKGFFDKALQICLSEGDSLYLAKTYMCLGDLNSKWGNYKESFDYYDKALQIYSDEDSAYVYYNLDTEVLQCLDRIALAYNSMDKHDDALKQLEVTLNLYQRHYPERKDLIANCYINIGTVLENKGDYNEAHRNFETALAILDSISDMPRLAYCYNNLGSLYEREDNYDEAIKFYEKGLDIYEDSYGSSMKEQMDVGYLYNNIASAYYNRANSTDNQLDYNEALDYFLKALHILSFRFDKNHPTVRTIQENIMTTINEMCLK